MQTEIASKWRLFMCAVHFFHYFSENFLLLLLQTGISHVITESPYKSVMQCCIGPYLLAISHSTYLFTGKPISVFCVTPVTLNVVKVHHDCPDALRCREKLVTVNSLATASDCKQRSQRFITLLQKLCSSDNRCSVRFVK